MDVKERIQKYLDFKGIKTATLEREVGMSNGYWRKTKSISANIVSDILRAYSDLSEKWVLFGEGTMCGCSLDDPSLYHRSPSAPVDGVSTDLQRTHSGGTTEADKDKEIAMLRQLLDEKERTIRAKDQTIELLLSQREGKE